MRVKRLKIYQWHLIKLEIEKNIPMAQIARDNKISRTALYQYAYRHGWIRKKGDTIWSRLTRYFKVNGRGNRDR